MAGGPWPVTRQGWPASAPDQRTFALQQQRSADDLNRPDLVNVIMVYLQDAIRYFQRKPFFFNDTDNTALAPWQANTFFTQGAAIVTTVTIPFPPSPLLPWTPNTNFTVGVWVQDTNGNYQQCTVAGLSGVVQPLWNTQLGGTTLDGTVTWTLTGPVQTIVAVNLIAGTTSAAQPTFTNVIYQVPSTLTSPPIFVPGPGTTVDNTTLWATIGPYQQGIYAELWTVPSQNQYVPPLDYVSPRRVEVTWSGNLRIGMTKITYDELRDYDVIRPTPPTTYPTWWAWYQEQLYFWPYPVSFYPITLSYLAAPPLPINAQDSNFWTTKAEALIRYWACARICQVVLHDDEASQDFYTQAAQELNTLTSQRIRQNTSTEMDGIPPGPW